MTSIAFRAFPEGLKDGIQAPAIAAYWTAVAFVGVVIVRSVLKYHGPGQAYWVVLGGGLLLRLLGSATWVGFELFDLPKRVLEISDVAYATSYALLFCALLWLVAKTTSSICLTMALDSLAVILSVGLLVNLFVLDNLAWSSVELRSLFTARSGPVCDVGLLCLALVVASTDRRPPYAPLFAGAFATFLVADGLYLSLGSSDSYEFGGWTELSWAIGVALVGLAALKATPSVPLERQIGVTPWVVYAFWLGPLSPAIHLGFLLVWCALRPPLPSYALLTGALLSAYMAIRVSMDARTSRKLRDEAEALAVRAERGRLSEELHDTLKQCVHSVPLILGSYKKARKRGDEATAEAILEHALQASEEASQRVSLPVYELRAADSASALDPLILVDHMLEDMERSFGVAVERDVTAPLGELHPEQAAAAYRIASEALWNAAKHGKASKVRFKVHRVGAAFFVSVRDDGCGFSEEDVSKGLGLALMRGRAEGVGATLDVFSHPGRGTTVQVRFEEA